MRNIFVLSILCLLNISAASAFSLKTSSFNPKKPMPEKHVYNSFGCKGENVSPALEWSDPPEGTKSFAVTVYDPDAPTGSGWWHWTVANIPATTTKITEGASNKNKLPKGSIEGRTDFGSTGYGGPCPPKGDKPHRYVFTIYAISKDKLDVSKESSGAAMGFNIKANTLGEASFTVKYGR